MASRIICSPDGKNRDTGKIIRFDEYTDKDDVARFEWIFPTCAKTEKMSIYIGFNNESDVQIFVRVDDVRLSRYDPEKGVELLPEKPGSP